MKEFHVKMQADEGNRSAGHVYAVSRREFKRLVQTRCSVRVEHGAGHRMERGFLAVKAPVERRTTVKRRPVAEKVAVKFDRSVGQFNAGRTYSFPPGIAKKYVNGYKDAGGVHWPSVGSYVEAKASSSPFRADRVHGITPRKVAEMAAMGIKTAAQIAAASIRDLVSIKGIGKPTAERLKLAARAYAG